MAADDDWRHQWWYRRFAPGVAIVVGALYVTARGRQYAHEDALVMAGGGVVATAAIWVALYLGLPILGRQFNEETQRFDPAPHQTFWGWLASAMLTLTCVGATIVVLAMLIAGAP